MRAALALAMSVGAVAAALVAAAGIGPWAVDAASGETVDSALHVDHVAPQRPATPRRPSRRGRAGAGGRLSGRSWCPPGEVPPGSLEPFDPPPPPPEPDADATIVGRVLDVSGRPVAGAQIRAFLGTGTPESRTGDDGRFTVGVRRPTGVARCVVWADGLAVTVTPWAALDPGATLDVGTLTLVPAERIEGRVLGRDGGTLADASVGIDGTQSYGYDDWCLIAYCTDLDVAACDRESGAFHTGSLRAGPYSLEPRSPVAAPAYPFPAACPSSGLDLRMDPKPLVVDAAESVPAVCLNYGFSRLGRRGPRCAPEIPPDSREPDDPPPPEDPAPFGSVTLRLRPPTDVATLDEADALVVATLRDGSSERRRPYYELSGTRIRIANLAVGESFRITLNLRAGREWLRPIRLDGVLPAALEIDVPVTRGPALAGRVVRHDGTPVPGAWVRAERAADGVRRDGHSRIDGRFALTGLDAGPWDVAVTAPGWEWRGAIDVPESGLADRALVVAPDRP